MAKPQALEAKGREMSATKIGSVPNMRATVAAVVNRTEYANVTWFSQMPSAGTPSMNQTCSRRTRRLLAPVGHRREEHRADREAGRTST